MIERYSRKEIKNIWNDKNKYSIWLDIEIAAAEAMEKLKIIPKGISKKVKSKAKIDVQRILKIEEKVIGRDFKFYLSNSECMYINSPCTNIINNKLDHKKILNYDVIFINKKL